MTVVYGYVHLPALQQKGDDINAVLVRGECFHAVYIYMGEFIFCPRPGAVDRVIEHFYDAFLGVYLGKVACQKGLNVNFFLQKH